MPLRAMAFGLLGLAPSRVVQPVPGCASFGGATVGGTASNV